MKKTINRVNIEGLLYEHDLEEKVSGPTANNPGANFIRGSISIQIEENNIVTVDVLQFEMGKKGKDKRYDKLLSIKDSNSVVKNGVAQAAKIKISSALDLNDFYNQDYELISSLRSFSGFYDIVSSIDPKATFETDILITSTTDELEKDEDGLMAPNGNLVVNGYIFNYRENIMPVKFTVQNEKGISYFKGLPANTFTKVWGKIVTNINKISKTEESAFGEDKVVEYTKTKKRFIISGANAEPYEFGVEGILTVEEVQKAIADRNLYLENEKTRTENYRNQAGTNSAASDKTQNIANSGNDFNF